MPSLSRVCAAQRRDASDTQGASKRPLQETRPGQEWLPFEVRTSPPPAPGKPGASFDAAPVDGQLRSAHAAAHPIGWMRRPHPASRAKTPHASSDPRAEGPERRQSPAVTPELHHPTLSASPASRERGSRAWDTNVCRRCSSTMREVRITIVRHHPFGRAAPWGRSLWA